MFNEINLDKLQLYPVPQLPDGTIYQQGGAPPHFANTDYLKKRFKRNIYA